MPGLLSRRPAPITRDWRGATTSALALALGVAAALRAYRLEFDLPEVQYVDGFKFAGEAARMAASGDYRPTLFQYPGLYVNLLAVLYRALGVTSEYGAQLTALWVSATLGMATVAMTARAASSVSRGPGIVVAVALAASSGVLVAISRTPAPDATCVFFVTACIVGLATQPTRLRAWAAIGAAAGLAVSAKWTGALVIPVAACTLLSIAWQQRRGGFVARAGAAAAAMGLATFLATTPFFVRMYDSYGQHLAFEAQLQRAGQIGRVQAHALDYLVSTTPTWEAPWLGTSLRTDLGLPALLAALAGIGLAVGGRINPAGRLYAATAVAYLAVISGPGRIKALRFLAPIVPMLCVLAGAVVERALPPALRRRPIAWVAATLALTAVPLQASVRYALALRRPSTNVEAREWLARHLAPESVVFLGPFFTEDFVRFPFRFVRLDHPGTLQYGLPAEIGPSPERTLVYSGGLIDELREAGVEYVVLNSYYDAAFSRVGENARFFPRAVAGYEAFQARLQSEASLVYAVYGWRDGRVGPDVAVWRFNPPAPRSPG